MRDVSIAGPLYLVASYQAETKLGRLRQNHPNLPDSLDQLFAELNSRPGGVWATIDPPGSATGDAGLVLHGATWTMRLAPTREFRGARRGYFVNWVGPLRLRDHHRLAQGCFLLRAAAWLRVFDVRDLPDTANADWQRLVHAHQQVMRDLAAARGVDDAPSLTVADAAYLDRLSSVIDANERITTATADGEKPYTYRDVRPVGEQRRGSYPMYQFLLVDDRRPTTDTFVQVRGEDGQRGQVTREDPVQRAVTVRFDQPVDWDLLSRTGELVVTPSRVVFQKQREALTRLRDGLANNPHLLSVLVDHRTCPLSPHPTPPTEKLDPGQQEALDRGVAVEDLLLVLGPPGTGKTRVISQLARAVGIGAVGRPPGRVLVTSHTNRAVDNVLGRLPRDLVVVRVGNEGKVTDEGRPYLLETQAGELRERILRTVDANARGFGDLEVAERWTGELVARTDELGAALGRQAQEHATWLAARQDAGGPAQAAVDRLAADLGRWRRAVDRCDRRLDQNSRRAARFPLFARWFARQRSRLATQASQLRTDRDTAEAALDKAERQLDEATRLHPAVLDAQRALDAANQALADALASALVAAHSARAAAGGTEPAPDVRDEGTPADTYVQLKALAGWLTDRLPIWRQRARLLAEWRAEVSGASSQLYPELVRYADVIAATCIGAASRPELSEVDFELAIVDEAGQIGTADVLVPLVRARRAVLVGDQQQLPPFLDSEVERWGAGIGDPQVRALLSHSALEILVDQLGPHNQVPLTVQRRMPRVIAEFVSARFYRGTLVTDVERQQRDQVFRRAFAFVDTARLPDSRRRERPARDLDRGMAGCFNPAEAELLARLAAHYDRLHQEWAIIVPYQAQLRKVSGLLVGRIGQQDKVRASVGTVDSFQGGERDVVLYGFTRSNPYGQIGFLRELRRANVAFTRAKQQLVLVGDLGTLTSAQDLPFRELATGLRDYVAELGDIRQYEDIADIMTRMGST